MWDSCTLYEKEQLDRIQYEAARVVTGLTRSVTIARLIREIGWVSLQDRRNIQKLLLFHDYKTDNIPGYLHSIFPDTVANTNHYNLRNRDDYATIARRLEIYSKSVIPSTVKLWNELDAETQSIESLNAFKQKLKTNT